MQDEFLLAGAAGVGIELLGVFAGAEGAEGDGLGFTALEKSRTVGARQQADFAVDGAHVFEAAAVQPLVLVHDQAANSFLLDVIKGILEDELGDFFRAELLDELLANLLGERADGGFAGEFAGRQQGGDDAVARPKSWLRGGFPRERYSK